PSMTDFQGEAFADGRLPYNFGHAAFEFVESQWGKEGVRQFLFALRKNAIGGGESAYEEVFQLEADEFDDQFRKYLKDRFKPFRDKERPADYGRRLTPKREKTPYVAVLSIEPSPSGDLLAVAAGNRKDQELDIVLLSTRDGTVIRNLTDGFNKDRGYEYIVTPGGFRNNAVPWMSWSPSGDRIAYFARTEKLKSLILQNVVTRNIDQRIELKLDMPESPDISPTGKEVAFSALSGGIGDIFVVDLETSAVRNVTNDQFGDYAPTWSPDGKSLVYVARVSGNDKLFRLDTASGARTQLTFGAHDDGGAQFMAADTIIFPSTALDPNQAIDPDVARNGNIYNLWTLNLRSGELRQYTDTLTAAVSPAVLRAEGAVKVAFVTYFKGEYAIHLLNRDRPLQTVASADFGSPGPVIDFQTPLSHTLVRQNVRKKGTFDKLLLESRPPVNVGVTSGGDLFGGTAVSFADVLGDRRVDLMAASVARCRTFAGSYVDISRRLQWAVQGFSQTQFFFGNVGGVFFDPALTGLVDRDLATATRTVQGVSAFGVYPLNRYRRLEFSGGVAHYSEEFEDAAAEEVSRQFQVDQFGRPLLLNGFSVPFGVEFVQETTIFREFGPLAGNTVRLAYEIAPSIGDSLSRQTVDADARYYQRLGDTGVLALRARAFRSWGDAPGFTFFGGNSELRGYEYLEFVGQNAIFAYAELRFPLIHAMATPIDNSRFLGKAHARRLRDLDPCEHDSTARGQLYELVDFSTIRRRVMRMAAAPTISAIPRSWRRSSGPPVAWLETMA
ncbi:MAG: hypothetical protein ACRD15_04455, partial [Vicinamibacterales bacterium]